MQANSNNLSWVAEASELCGLYKYSTAMMLGVIMTAESTHRGKRPQTDGQNQVSKGV